MSHLEESTAITDEEKAEADVKVSHVEPYLLESFVAQAPHCPNIAGMVNLEYDSGPATYLT